MGFRTRHSLCVSVLIGFMIAGCDGDDDEPGGMNAGAMATSGGSAMTGVNGGSAMVNTGGVDAGGAAMGGMVEPEPPALCDPDPFMPDRPLWSEVLPAPDGGSGYPDYETMSNNFNILKCIFDVRRI